MQTNISFGSEYSAAVERKQIAQQDAERAKFVVDKAEQTKKSRIIQARQCNRSTQPPALPPCACPLQCLCSPAPCSLASLAPFL